MKTSFNFFIALILGISYANLGYSQDKFTKDVMPIAPEYSNTESLLIKNKNADNVLIDGVLLDKRAAKYYFKNDLIDLSKQKVLAINFLYINSYALKTSESKLSNDCIDNIKNNFDLGEYNRYRKANERVILPVKYKECGFVIELFSWNEIDNYNK